MRRSNHGQTALLLVLILIAGACGGRDAAPAAEAQQEMQPAAEQAGVQGATDVDPCSLLTAAEAQEITGKTFSDGSRNEYSSNVCMYEAAGGANFNFALQPASAGNTAELMISRFAENGVTITAAPGMGDRSFWSSQQGMTQLNSYQGAWYVMMTAAFIADDPTQEKAAVARIMERVLSRL